METKPPTEEKPPVASEEKPPEHKVSKFEQAIVDELAEIKKHLGIGENKSPVVPKPTAPVVPETVIEEEEDNGHDTENCPCPFCLFDSERD